MILSSIILSLLISISPLSTVGLVVLKIYLYFAVTGPSARVVISVSSSDDDDAVELLNLPKYFLVDPVASTDSSLAGEVFLLNR